MSDNKFEWEDHIPQAEDMFEPRAEWAKFINTGDTYHGILKQVFDKDAVLDENGEQKFPAQRVYQIITAGDKKLVNIGLPKSKSKVHEALENAKEGEVIAVKYTGKFKTQNGYMAKGYRAVYKEGVVPGYDPNVTYVADIGDIDFTE
jgi:hypothetical protein